MDFMMTLTITAGLLSFAMPKKIKIFSRPFFVFIMVISGKIITSNQLCFLNLKLFCHLLGTSQGRPCTYEFVNATSNSQWLHCVCQLQLLKHFGLIVIHQSKETNVQVKKKEVDFLSRPVGAEGAIMAPPDFGTL